KNGSVKVTRTDLHRCYSPISFTVIRTAPATGTVTVSLGRYQGLTPAFSIRNRESMTHVSYSF
ncbi:hypothetical protein QU796_21620, partial [Escherichia coli]|nr:hypothetical protein [Escherichia coli]